MRQCCPERGRAQGTLTQRPHAKSTHSLAFIIQHTSLTSQNVSGFRSYDQRPGSFDEHVSGILTAVSPLTSPTRPLSQESGRTYTDLTGPSYSSTPATPADRQNRRGTRRFTSPVPSTSTSSKRARMANDSVASVDLGLFLNSSVNSSSTSPYDELSDDDAVESATHGPAGDGSGSQLQRGDLPGHLQPALKARVDRYIQERVGDAVERAVARFKGKLDALQSRVDQLETALKQKETVTPSRQKVDKEVSVSTYFRHCN